MLQNVSWNYFFKVQAKLQKITLTKNYKNITTAICCPNFDPNFIQVLEWAQHIHSMHTPLNSWGRREVQRVLKFFLRSGGLEFFENQGKQILNGELRGWVKLIICQLFVTFNFKILHLNILYKRNFRCMF